MEIKEVNRDGRAYFQVVGNTERFGKSEILCEELTEKAAKAYIKKINNQAVNLIFGLAVQGKKEMYDKFIERTEYFTSDGGFSGSFYVSDEGFYFDIEGTRSKFVAFVSYEGAVMRKPRNVNFHSKYNIKGMYYEIDNIYKEL